MPHDNYPNNKSPYNILGLGLTLTYRVWRCLCSGRNYKQGLMKSSCILDPTLCYIHIVIERLFANKADSKGVMGNQELLYLYSMIEHRSLHLQFILVEFLAYQGQHTRLRYIFAEPYIAHLIWGIILFRDLEDQDIVGGIPWDEHSQIHWDGYPMRGIIYHHSLSQWATSSFWRCFTRLFRQCDREWLITLLSYKQPESNDSSSLTLS